MRHHIVITGLLCLTLCSGTRSQSQETTDNRTGNKAVTQALENDRSSGVRCGDLQFLSPSGEPLVAVRINLARAYIKSDPQHPSKTIVNFAKVVPDRITNKGGHFPFPVLETGTYLIGMQGAEKPSWGWLRVFRWMPPQMCSQVFIAGDNGNLHALR